MGKSHGDMMFGKRQAWQGLDIQYMFGRFCFLLFSRGQNINQGLDISGSKSQLRSMGEEVGISWEYRKLDGGLGLGTSMV